MKIELKKIKHYPKLSEETEAFTAELYVDDKKVADVRNDGRGGCNFCYSYDKNSRSIIKQAEEFCKTLPPVTSDYEDVGDLPMDLDFKISLLLGEYLEEKERKKHEQKLAKDILRDMKKGIVYKTENGHRISSWKGHTIESLLKREDGRNVIKKTLSEFKSQGHQILNTNIPKELFAE